jgi:DNA-binding MarR family transcriptional regulator
MRTMTPTTPSTPPTDPVTAVARALTDISRGRTYPAPRLLSPTAATVVSTLQLTGPRRITDLAEIAGVTQPSMTSLVTTLEKSGLVRRDHDPSDRRAVLVSVTGEGAARSEAHVAGRTAALAELVAELPDADLGVLQRALPALQRLAELNHGRLQPADAPST